MVFDGFGQHMDRSLSRCLFLFCFECLVGVVCCWFLLFCLSVLGGCARMAVDQCYSL